MVVDLHIHTTASDGSLSPEVMVEKAYNFGYDAISITDHDTVDGLIEAIKAGERFGVEVIPGIEINTEYKNHEVHILGYFIDYKDKLLLEKLEQLKKFRIKRVKKMVKKLNELNIDIAEKEVFSISNGGAVGRTHIARVLVDRGYVESFSEAFDRYIAIGKPAYVKRKRLTPEESINLIKKTGGISVLAHPALVGSEMIVEDIIEMGIRGLEVYYYEHSDQETAQYLELADEYNLLVTGGSDDHGPGNKDGLRLGKMKLDYKIVENLKRCINLSVI